MKKYDSVWTITFFDENQKLLVGLDNGWIEIFTIEGYSFITFKAHNGSISAIKLLLDDTRLATCSSDCTINIFKFDKDYLKRFNPKPI